jgi:hypothetical protein
MEGYDDSEYSYFEEELHVTEEPFDIPEEWKDIKDKIEFLRNIYKETCDEIHGLYNDITESCDKLTSMNKMKDVFIGTQFDGAYSDLVESFESTMDLIGKEMKIRVLLGKKNVLKNILNIKNSTMCNVCLEKTITHFNDPCGHTFCNACIGRQNRSCPMCRTTVIGARKLFL